MNKIFKQNYNTLSFTDKEKAELGNLQFYAIDNHITKESDMEDDYIAFYKEWCILVTFKTNKWDKSSLLKLMYSTNYTFETTFNGSGSISEDYRSNELINCFSKVNTVCYFINTNNPNRVYITDYISDKYSEYKKMKNANSFLEKQEALAEFRKNSIYIDKILNNMNTQTFVNDGDYKAESDINKLVRFANSNLNKFVRNKVKKYLDSIEYIEYDFFNEDIYYLIGASSPKRNVIHNIVNTFNDLDVLVHYLIAKEDKLERYVKNKEQIQKQENINMFKNFVKKYPIFLKGYNYYENELYVMCNGVHVTLETEGFSWYDKYDKYDEINLYDLYKYTNIKNM